MARCERYTGGGRGNTERFIENSRERRCNVTKDETCNNRGICSFSSCSFTQRLLTAGLVASARALKISPRLLFSTRQTSPSSASPPAATSFSPPVTTSVVSLSPVLEFRSCSCRIPPRTNLNKRPPVVPRRQITWSFKSSVTIIVSEASRCYVSTARDPVSRFHRNVDPSLTPYLLSKRTRFG